MHDGTIVENLDLELRLPVLWAEGGHLPPNVFGSNSSGESNLLDNLMSPALFRATRALH